METYHYFQESHFWVWLGLFWKQKGKNLKSLVVLEDWRSHNKTDALGWDPSPIYTQTTWFTNIWDVPLNLAKKKKFIRFFRTLWFKLLIASSLNYWPRFTLQHFCLMSFNISHLWLSCYSYGFVSTLCLNENRLCRSKKAWWVKTHH